MKDVYEKRWERQPVWLTLCADAPAGFTMLVPMPGEPNMWLVHGIPTKVLWKRYPNMGERAYTDRNEYLGWFYKPSRHLRDRAFSKVHPQIQELMIEEGTAP